MQHISLTAANHCDCARPLVFNIELSLLQGFSNFSVFLFFVTIHFCMSVYFTNLPCIVSRIWFG